MVSARQGGLIKTNKDKQDNLKNFITMSRKKRHPLPRCGETIEITARLCGEKVQPGIRVGTAWVVKETGKLKDGTDALTVCRRGEPKKEARVNAARFEWTIVTAEMMRERMFRRQCERDTLLMQKRLTVREQESVAVVPLIFACLAFHYGGRCRRTAADRRIPLLSKASRAFDELERGYRDDLAKDLDRRHVEKIGSETMRLMGELEKDFLILWFSVNGEFKKKMPSYPDDDLRTDALCGMMMVDLWREQSRYAERLIASRLGRKPCDTDNPRMGVLRTILGAYARADGKFDFMEKNVRMAREIVRRKVSRTEFHLLDRP